MTALEKYALCPLRGNQFSKQRETRKKTLLYFFKEVEDFTKEGSKKWFLLL